MKIRFLLKLHSGALLKNKTGLDIFEKSCSEIPVNWGNIFLRKIYDTMCDAAPNRHTDI